MSRTASIANRSFLVNRIITLVSRSARPRTSGTGAGRAEAAGLARSYRGKAIDDREVRPRDPGEHELGDPVAGRDRDSGAQRVAVPCRYQQRPFVIGIDHPHRVAEDEPLAMAQTRARYHQGAPLRGADTKGYAGRDQHRRRLRRQEQRRVDASVQVEPRGELRAIMRKAPRGEARIEQLQLDLEGHRARAPAMRSASRAATSCLLIAGQCSIPAASTRWIVLVSPPNVPVPGETSLARIQSQPFFSRLACAAATMSVVSAAKPTTSAGRSLPRRAIVARMSGFSTRRRAGGPPPSFFNFWAAMLSTRQSDTAAAITATSTGSAASLAASISAAVSTATRRTPGGGGSAVGPDTSTVSAPRAAKAAAIAWPCLPEEWFDR